MNNATLMEQFHSASCMRQAGRMDDARQIYEQILAAYPRHAPSLYYLSILFSNAGRRDEAVELLRRAIVIEPVQAAYHYELGNLLNDQGATDLAQALYQRAIDLKPDFFQAHNQIGLLYQKSERIDDSERHFRDAVHFGPNYAKAHNNLGNVLRTKKALDEAIACFQEALRIQPDYFIAYVNLGEVLQQQGRVDEAAENYAKAIHIKPNEFDPYVKLGMALIAATKLEAAEVVLRQALALKPDDAWALVNIAYSLKEQGKLDEALMAYEKAMKRDEILLVAAIGANLSLPPIYSSEDEIFAARKRYSEGLERLRKNAHLYKRRSSQAMTLIWGNFLLAYQGLNDRDLQKSYGEFLADLLRSDAPEFFEPMELKVELTGRRLRIGILSSFLRTCTVGSYFKSWITSIDKSRLEIFVYFTGHAQDAVSKEIADASDHFVHLVGLTPGIARRVKSDALDILVYPEIGMDAGVCTLAALRLAPVQCAAWGHPTTTGYPNIDYYFSSALMEPQNAADHYTEKLVLLDGLGTCYTQPAMPEPASRAEFGLPDDRTLYLCPQSLFKIHPGNDEVLVSIVEGHHKATLVFFQGMFTETTNIFVQRLVKLFEARGIDKAERVKILPRLQHADYLKVNRLCDVMLDTLYWSGGNTSLDALACGLPIVTLPGELMRGRQSFGMLSAMGLTELIAHDKQEYLCIALRLGHDSEWRQQISRRIEENTHRIFGKTESIRDLERFFLSFAP